MNHDRLQLIIKTIETQLSLLKLELETKESGPEPKEESIIKLNLEDLIKRDPFAAYDPTYHEEQ